jgi:hypothetical protein
MRSKYMMHNVRHSRYPLGDQYTVNNCFVGIDNSYKPYSLSSKFVPDSVAVLFFTVWLVVISGRWRDRKDAMPNVV